MLGVSSDVSHVTTFLSYFILSFSSRFRAPLRSHAPDGDITVDRFADLPPARRSRINASISNALSLNDKTSKPDICLRQTRTVRALYILFNV